jgi:2-polyprenyl-6-methoxyphenol hydroxylase-like FAD-dependent oxidoreductase
MSTLPAAADVVIVGAGPTGLALACVLAAEGISFILVERLAEGANTSRAAGAHARTLEVLEGLGVTDRLRVAGLVVPRFTVHDCDHVLLTIRFDGLPTRYAYTLMVLQNITEEILLGRLRELGSDVYRPYAVADVQQDADGVTAVVVADGQQRRRCAPDTSSAPTVCTARSASAPASVSPPARMGRRLCSPMFG